MKTGSWDAVTPLVSLGMKLFFRLVDRHMPFHITLISVCFTNLQLCCLGTRGSIVSFFSQGSPVKPKEAPSAEVRRAGLQPNYNLNVCRSLYV